MPSSKNQTVLHWARKTKGFYLITVHKFLQILYVIFSSVLQACDSTSGCVPGCSQLISASFAMFFFFLHVFPGILVTVICSEMSNVS